MEDFSKFCHLTIDEIKKEAYVWHEENWRFSDEFHSHKKGQLIYVEKGFQYLYVNNNKYLLPQHYCAYIPPNLIHKSTTPLDDVFLRTMYFSITSTKEYYKKIHIFHTPVVLREMILHCEKYSRIKAYDPVEALFLKTILESLPEFSNDSYQLILPLPSHPQLKDMVQNIADNLSEVGNINEQISKLGMSQRTFQRLFKKETGMSFSAYIKLLRMVKAVELLSGSEKNISEVAYQVGYANLSTFSTTFKQILGITPQKFFL